MKRTKSYSEKDYYVSYLDHTKRSDLYYIDFKIFTSILRDYFEYISRMIIEKAAEIKLPSQLGAIYVKKRGFKPQRKHLNVDFKSTNEMGKTILHLNEHTNGYSYMFKWRKKEMNMQAKILYQLVMTRANKRHLAACIKNKLTDYIEE